MEGFRLNGVGYVHLFWLVAAMTATVVTWSIRRKKLLRRLADARMLPVVTSAISSTAMRARNMLYVAALACIVVGLLRPAWETAPVRIKRAGRDVVFLVDVSNSMLATDMKPNRLEMAKLAILDAADVASGDRLALVAFAGTAVLKCPLTFDYVFFKQAVKDLSPTSVTRAGTRIGDAIRKVVNEILKKRHGRESDIILVTDGEDHESFPVEAAKDAGKAGIRIIAIGLGDPDTGTRIPLKDENGNVTFLKDSNGNYVYSRLGWRTLQEIAYATPGGRAYKVPPGSTIDLADIYTKLITQAPKKSGKEQIIRVYDERFQIPLLAAFILLCIEVVLSTRVKGAAIAKTATILLLLLSVAGREAEAASWKTLLKEGNDLYRNGKYKEAIKKYDEAGVDAPTSPLIPFNKGVCLYRQSEYAKAFEMFEEAASKAIGTPIEAKGLYNAAACLVKGAEKISRADPMKALANLKRAMELYRKIRREHPNFRPTDTENNMRVVSVRIKQLIDLLKKQQEAARKQAAARKNLERKLQQLKKKQNQLNDQTKSDTTKPGSFLAKKQKKIRNQTKEAEEEASRIAPPVKKDLEQAVKQQRASEEALAAGNKKKALEHQEEALRHIEEALKKMKGSGKKEKRRETADKNKKKGEKQPEAKRKKSEAGDTSMKARRNKTPQNLDAYQILGEVEQDKKKRMYRRTGGVMGVEKPW